MLKTSKGFHRVVVIGCGHVVQTKVATALCNLLQKGMVSDALYCDIKENVLPEKLSHLRFKAIRDPRKIVDQLRDLGWLGPDVLVLVCTPSEYHVSYAIALADFVGHVAVEKPLALAAKEAERLIAIGHKMTPIEHQVYKEEMIDLCIASREGRLDWSAVRHASFVLHEDSGVGERQIDDLIFDTGYHGLACIVAALSQQYSDPEIIVSESQISTYFNGPDKPKKCTAAWMRGRILAGRIDLPFDISVGKGLSRSEKGLTLRSNRGETQQASLNESGHHAHQRVIEQILDPDRSKPLLGLQESVSIVRACSEAIENAATMPDYAFGTAPLWDRSRSKIAMTLNLLPLATTSSRPYCQPACN